jgi:hypothetical protein
MWRAEQSDTVAEMQPRNNQVSLKYGKRNAPVLLKAFMAPHEITTRGKSFSM